MATLDKFPILEQKLILKICFRNFFCINALCGNVTLSALIRNCSLILFQHSFNTLFLILVPHKYFAIFKKYGRKTRASLTRLLTLVKESQ